MRKMIYLVGGAVMLMLGVLGAVVPVLPTVPFLLAATYCFARGSQRLHNWFVHTRLYHDHLQDYVAGKGMTGRTKIRIMISVTALMGIGFWMMKNTDMGRIILFCVWVFHIVYFVFGIKTIQPSKEVQV